MTNIEAIQPDTILNINLSYLYDNRQGSAEDGGLGVGKHQATVNIVCPGTFGRGFDGQIQHNRFYSAEYIQKTVTDHSSSKQ